MKIDFNKVMSVADPDEILIDVDGKDYKLKDPSVLDVAGFDAVRVQGKGESNEEHGQRVLGFVRNWFEGDAPPFLSGPMPTEPKAARALLKKISALMGVLIEVISEIGSLPNAVARGREATRAQFQDFRSGSAS